MRIEHRTDGVHVRDVYLDISVWFYRNLPDILRKFYQVREKETQLSLPCVFSEQHTGHTHSK